MGREKCLDHKGFEVWQFIPTGQIGLKPKSCNDCFWTYEGKRYSPWKILRKNWWKLFRRIGEL